MLAKAGADMFEEVFKLIFTKLYDKFYSKKDKGIIEYYLNQNLDNENRSDFDNLREYLTSLNDD